MPYWTLHRLGHYWKRTKHHRLFLCCLVFSKSWWGGGWNCCFTGDPGLLEALVCLTLEWNVSSLEPLAKVNGPFWPICLLEIPNTRWVPGHLGAGEQPQAALPAGQAARKPAANQAASKRIRASGQGENGGSCQETGSWAGASRALGQLARVPAWYLARWSLVVPRKVMRPSLQFRKIRGKKVFCGGYLVYRSWKANRDVFQLFLTTTKVRDLLTT